MENTSAEKPLAFDLIKHKIAAANKRTQKIPDGVVIPRLDLDKNWRYGIEFELKLKSKTVAIMNERQLAKFFIDKWRDENKISLHGFPMISDISRQSGRTPIYQADYIDKDYMYWSQMINLFEDHVTGRRENELGEGSDPLTRAVATNNVELRKRYEAFLTSSKVSDLRKSGCATKIGCWLFVEEPAIRFEKGEEFAGYIGCEIISPILYYAPNPNSFTTNLQIIQQLYDFMGTHMDIRAQSSHVHVSPRRNWSVDGVKRLMCSAFYFEPAFNKLFPDYRNKLNMCLGFRDSRLVLNCFDVLPAKAGGLIRKYNEKSLKIDGKEGILYCLQQIEGIDEVVRYYRKLGPDATVPHQAILEALINIMNPKEHGKFMAWNFRNLSAVPTANIKEAKGTIEHRKPPGSKTAKDGLHWAILTITFISAAMRRGTSAELANYDGDSLDSLKLFMQDDLPTDMQTLNDWTGGDFYRPGNDIEIPLPPANVAAPADKPKEYTQSELDEAESGLIKLMTDENASVASEQSRVGEGGRPKEDALGGAKHDSLVLDNISKGLDETDPSKTNN